MADKVDVPLFKWPEKGSSRPAVPGTLQKTWEGAPAHVQTLLHEAIVDARKVYAGGYELDMLVSTLGLAEDMAARCYAEGRKKISLSISFAIHRTGAVVDVKVEHFL